MLNDTYNCELVNTFYKGRKKLRISFHERNIIWDQEKRPSKKYTLPIENVITVHHSYSSNADLPEGVEIDPNSFTIHYTKRGKYDKWLYKDLTLKHSDPLQVSVWVNTLNNYLQCLKQRPKRLLLFVNPISGKRNALHIYEKYGKHLFFVAGIQVTLNISQRKDYIKDYVVNENLDIFDTIACVGGDGTVSELFNGLVLRECRLKGVNADDINQDLPKPKIPVGVIPGGSTDAIAYCIHGTTDPVTAVLHIILGDSLGLDLVSVYDERCLLRLCGSALSYGYLGNVANHSEQYRWMGPCRYEYSGFREFLKNRGYNAEIAIYSESAGVDEVTCRENCEKCEISKKTDCDQLECKWQTLLGKFLMVTGANISCACSRAPKGLAPYSHLGNGLVHLVLIKHTTLLNNFRLFLRLICASTIEDLPFVETISAREFCFKAINKHSSWNFDGEVQHQTNIRAKVHCQLITICSRGSSRHAPPKSAFCGLF